MALNAIDKPVLLDAFCGAGGMTKGFQEAGFFVVGIDLHPQPNYPGEEFVQMDALVALRLLLAGGTIAGRRLEDFAFIHASPPCQASANVTKWRGDQAEHPELIPQTRELLEQTGLPYVIENLPEAPIRPDLLLCGSQFGLPIRRHRAFECNWLDPTTVWGKLPPCSHSPSHYSFDHGAKQPESVYRDAMGCGWMTVAESRQAIPPAYARFIGDLFLKSVLSLELEEVA